MPTLPQPDDLTSLVLRTDFSDDTAWAELQAALGDDSATFVSDPGYAGVTIQALADADADDTIGHVFLADTTTMTGEERLLLVVDLQDPSRTFRVALPFVDDISANLCLGNLDFDEFADATDEAGVYRGL